MNANGFRTLVYANYEKAARDFPWRGKVSPWGIMVSEFMLQQTRTERVLPFWEKWMKKWPRLEDAAKAPMEEVLQEWNGLGYNRRGYFLKKSAEMILRDYDGRIPGLPRNLLHLPGIGPYMAGAIPCFAYNYPSVFIETNIRSTVIHFFFPDRDDVKDIEIKPILEEALDRNEPRKWYYALMDYGAALKKQAGNPGRRSAHYVKQSPFEGSSRQKRGKVLRALLKQGPSKAEEIALLTEIGRDDLYGVLKAMEKESLVAEAGGVYRINS